MLAAEDFGTRLRRQREHLGITLDAVAESTKIKRSLLNDLERGDLSHWPVGIFRRAFLREYAHTIGASPAETVNECLRLFPEPGGPPSDDRRYQSGGEAVELRLTMASPGLGQVDRRRMMAVLVDTAVVAALGAAAALVSGASFWMMAAAAAVIYYGCATAWLGKSPASWWLRPRFHHRSTSRYSRGLPVDRSIETDARTRRNDGRTLYSATTYDAPRANRSPADVLQSQRAAAAPPLDS
jgi:transcriptional regulator with XRE-family HTH domain